MMLLKITHYYVQYNYISFRYKLYLYITNVMCYYKYNTLNHLYCLLITQIH